VTIRDFHEGLSKMLPQGWDPQTQVKMWNVETDGLEPLAVEECVDGSFVLEFEAELDEQKRSA
jgi:hypothetical protein